MSAETISPEDPAASSLVPDLLRRVIDSGVVDQNERMVVGVSGGRDSVCLLDLLAQFVVPANLLAVVVHHGIRQQSADRDALWAAKQATALGVACKVVHLDQAPETGSIAAWARSERYRVMNQAAQQWAGPDTPILLAHTLSDQAETVLMRAVSSPGIRPLAGMVPFDPKTRILRPLLAAGITREDTTQWCLDRSLGWQDDESNPTSSRGRVRAIIDELKTIDPRVEKTLSATAVRAREDEFALRELAKDLLDEYVSEHLLATDALRAAHKGVARRALRMFAEQSCQQSCPRIERRLEEVLLLDPANSGSAALDVGDNVRVVVTHNGTYCERIS